MHLDHIVIYIAECTDLYPEFSTKIIRSLQLRKLRIKLDLKNGKIIFFYSYIFLNLRFKFTFDHFDNGGMSIGK